MGISLLIHSPKGVERKRGNQRREIRKLKGKRPKEAKARTKSKVRGGR